MKIPQRFALWCPLGYLRPKRQAVADFAREDFLRGDLDGVSDVEIVETESSGDGFVGSNRDFFGEVLTVFTLLIEGSFGRSMFSAATNLRLLPGTLTTSPSFNRAAKRNPEEFRDRFWNSRLRTALVKALLGSAA